MRDGCGVPPKATTGRFKVDGPCSLPRLRPERWRANPRGQVHQTESKAAMNRRSPYDSASTTSTFDIQCSMLNVLMFPNPPGRTLSLFPSDCVRSMRRHPSAEARRRSPSFWTAAIHRRFAFGCMKGLRPRHPLRYPGGRGRPPSTSGRARPEAKRKRRPAWCLTALRRR